MINPGHRPKETMQRNLEPSLKRISIKAFNCNCQGSGNGIEESHEYKKEMNAHQGDLVESDDTLKREAFAPPNLGYNRPIYQQEYIIWPNFYPVVQKIWFSHLNICGTQFYPTSRDSPFLVDNRTQYLPFKMSSQGYPQEFQYFVVIDFEATCDKENNPHPQEIIEFPSVLVNGVTGQLEASFQTYVRPSYHQHLSDFCKELTGIQQIQVDRGVPLSEALLMHDKWLEDKGVKCKNFAVVTWSNWDCRVMLESECTFKKVRKPAYFNRWINLKVPFQEVYGVRCNLKEAVQLSGLTWEGRAHCGLDDACNTARLLALLMTGGFRFSITNSLAARGSPLTGHPPDVGPKDPVEPNGGVSCPYCYCGVESNKCVVRKPGPTQGKWFFGCGNWTPSRLASCRYFVWVS